ncbi:hypothetical protein Tco_0412789 [Tanacetum coccineum]
MLFPPPYYSQEITEEKAFTNLLRYQCEDVRSRLSKLDVMIREMENMDDRLAIFDSLDCLRDTVRTKNDKLASLNQLLEQVQEGIHEKEGHVDVMDLSD